MISGVVNSNLDLIVRLRLIGGGCVKVSPPLCITEDAVREGLAVLEEAVGEAEKADWV